MLRPVAEFGLVKVWNALPSAFVHAESVGAFQSKLTAAAKRACLRNQDGWEEMYSVDASPRTLLVQVCFPRR